MKLWIVLASAALVAGQSGHERDAYLNQDRPHYLVNTFFAPSHSFTNIPFSINLGSQELHAGVRRQRNIPHNPQQARNSIQQSQGLKEPAHAQSTSSHGVKKEPKTYIKSSSQESPDEILVPKSIEINSNLARNHSPVSHQDQQKQGSQPYVHKEADVHPLGQAKQKALLGLHDFHAGSIARKNPNQARKYIQQSSQSHNTAFRFAANSNINPQTPPSLPYREYFVPITHATSTPLHRDVSAGIDDKSALEVLIEVVPTFKDGTKDELEAQDSFLTYSPWKTWNTQTTANRNIRISTPQASRGQPGARIHPNPATIKSQSPGSLADGEAVPAKLSAEEVVAKAIIEAVTDEELLDLLAETELYKTSQPVKRQPKHYGQHTLATHGSPDQILQFRYDPTVAKAERKGRSNAKKPIKFKYDPARDKHIISLKKLD